MDTHTHRSKVTQALITVAIMTMLVFPASVHAFSLSDVGTIAKKVTKRIALPVTIIVGTTADAMETYSHSHSISDSIGAGAKGAIERAGKAIAETVSDTVRLGKAAGKIIEDTLK